MVKTDQNSRFIFSIALLLFGLLSAAPLRPQNKATGPAPSESERQANLVLQDKASPQAHDSEVKLTGPQTPEDVRRAQIQADTRRLYLLSADLRAEVAKTYKESLSLTVLKKAEEVEKLARSLKLLMNQEAAARH